MVVAEWSSNGAGTAVVWLIPFSTNDLCWQGTILSGVRMWKEEIRTEHTEHVVALLADNSYTLPLCAVTHKSKDHAPSEEKKSLLISSMTEIASDCHTVTLATTYQSMLQFTASFEVA